MGIPRGIIPRFHKGFLWNSSLNSKVNSLLVLSLCSIGIPDGFFLESNWNLFGIHRWIQDEFLSVILPKSNKNSLVKLFFASTGILCWIHFWIFYGAIWNSYWNSYWIPMEFQMEFILDIRLSSVKNSI